MLLSEYVLQKIYLTKKHTDVKFIFSKKVTKVDKIFTIDLTFTRYVYVKSTMKISSNFVAFLENINFTYTFFKSTKIQKREN